MMEATEQTTMQNQYSQLWLADRRHQRRKVCCYNLISHFHLRASLRQPLYSQADAHRKNATKCETRREGMEQFSTLHSLSLERDDQPQSNTSGCQAVELILSGLHCFTAQHGTKPCKDNIPAKIPRCGCLWKDLRGRGK